MTPKTTEGTTRVVNQDGRLIFTLNDAECPVLWQVDHAHLSTAGFEVMAKDNAWHIRFKPLNDNPQDIAVYKNRDQAVAVLNDIQSALMQTRSEQVDRPGPPLRRSHMVLAGCSMILLVTLISILFQLVPTPSRSTTSERLSGNPSQGGPPALSSGIPQSADDVLQDPESAP